jgi:hypothetical protein
MAYEPRAGSLTLFKNDRKEKDSHPDYKGDGLDLDGNAVWISAWVKEGAKGKFMSLSIQKKEPKPAAPQQAPQTRQATSPSFADLNDDIPFAPIPKKALYAM